MIEHDITHHIQKYILEVLHYQRLGRFRDLRKPGVDTNLFSYHLKLLLKNGLIKKIDGGYTLDAKGLVYVDRISAQTLKIRTQPKIVSMLVIQNSNGDVLLQKRTKQPHIDTWTLPYGKLHIDDSSITAAASREASEKLNLSSTPQHVGDCYIRVCDGEMVLSSTLVHVFRYETDDIDETESITWARPHKLSHYELAPAVEDIVARTFFRDPYFFEEYVVAA